MVEKWDYTIVYVMSKGSRLGLYAKMDENEANEVVQKLQDDGCSIERVERLMLD